MISKICNGHSFYGSIRYICQEMKKAQILGVEGVRSHDKNLMIEDFRRQQGLRPEKGQACFHGILSFYPKENPSDTLILEIARKYLDGLQILNTQYAIVKHTDKAHLHVHVIANMVNNDGKSISDKWIALRGKKQAQQLTSQYNLTQALSKDLTLTHYQSLREPEQYRYKIYVSIKNHLRDSRSMEELQDKLSKLGIEIQYKYKGHTQEKQGISFRLGEYKFKGSEIDRNFSYGKLVRELSLVQRHALLLKNNPESSSRYQSAFDPNKENKLMPNIVTKEMSNILEALFKQEQIRDNVPYELSQAAERKKRIRQSQNHLRL